MPKMEPAQFVNAMVEFAEMVLREARDRGLSASRRYKRRRARKRTKGPPSKPRPRGKRAKGKTKQNPLALLEEE